MAFPTCVDLRCSVTNGWDRMPALITDEMVRTVATVGTYEEIGDKILERLGGFATRVALPLPAPEHEKLLLPSLRQAQSAKLGYAMNQGRRGWQHKHVREQSTSGLTRRGRVRAERVTPGRRGRARPR